MIRTEAPHTDEGMQYGGLVYRLRDGMILCGFTAQKHNVAFYVGRVSDEFREPMTQAGFSLGKGAVRFKKLDPILSLGWVKRWRSFIDTWEATSGA